MDNIPNEEMLELLGYGQDRSDGKLGSFPTHPPFPATAKEGRTELVSEHLNNINDFVKKCETDRTPWSIHFLPTQGNALLAHPRSTRGQPDVAVVRKLPEQLLNTNELYWSQLEATGEGESSSKRKHEAQAQGAAYTEYLLLARPDYISVPGIFFNATHFKLLLVNACDIYATDLIDWDSPIAQRLLYTWFWRLYHPEVDDTIKISRKSSEPPTFTVETEPGTFYEGCSILLISAGGPFGRRTTIFAPTSIRGTTTDATDRVIKEQYIEIGRKFEEGLILEKIHGDNKAAFPGVVRVGWHGTVKSDKGDVEVQEEGVVERVKKRLVLLDKAEPLARLRSPREFLMAIYDLLEITRVLWRKYKILHRDISPNNFLLREKSVIPDGPLPSELGDMCFSEYLLRSKTSPSLPHLPENTEAPESILPKAQALSPSSQLPEKNFDSARLSTRVVLIDYDTSEDQTPVIAGKKQPKDRTGTDIFTAVVVRAGQVRGGTHEFNPMPQLKAARDVYEHQYPDRLKICPPDEEIFRKESEPCPLLPFQHQLRYDAESVFWLFVWWALQIRPAESKDCREHFILPYFPAGCLHPDYQPLEVLLRQMATHLKGDHSLIPSRREPEYLHENFQRLILDFLFASYNEKFMGLEIHEELRKVKVDPSVSQPPSRTSTGKRKLEEEAEDAGAQRRKRPHFVKKEDEFR